MGDLNRLVSIEDLRQAARRRLPRAIFDFFDGGAEDEVTLRENRAAFERLRLYPRVLVNVAKVDLSADLLGARAALPLAIAPTGGISAGRAGAELALARAASAFGVPFTLATPAAFTPSSRNRDAVWVESPYSCWRTNPTYQPKGSSRSAIAGRQCAIWPIVSWS